ncbi:MAG: mucoidy inhibitor MuiA family protein [Rhodobacteraceae bacterium]|nr:mucoidy inhibitor MuiA family protein [Paracoccaceae bacterium]
MRTFLSVSLISLMASGVLAAEFTLDSEVSAATVYPVGALITRSMEFDVPAGRHRLIISDVPYQFARESLRIFGGEGLVFGATRTERARVQPDDLQLERRAELEREIETLEAQMTAKQEESAAAGLMISAANARIKLLDNIGNQQARGAAEALENQNISVETLTALITLVGSETLNALQDAQAARVEIAAISLDMQDLQEKITKANEELAQMYEPADWSYGISLEVEAEAATSGRLQISYVVNGAARWMPVYDFRLDTDAQNLQIDRKVTIMQETGEDWDNAAITVSTTAPFELRRFSKLSAQRARYEPPSPQIELRVEMDSAIAGLEVRMQEDSPAKGVPSFVMQGISASYILPAGTVISGDSEPSLITINSADFDVEITAQARAGLDETAFMIAKFINESQEPYLPGVASFFRDGAFVAGSREIELIAAGASSELVFGSIDGLLVERKTLRREDGESGVLTTSSDRVVEYELKVENVSNRDWDVVIYDRVPYSEQEDMVIDWRAKPRPSEVDVDGQRGVMAWAFPLASGASKVVDFSYELQWPAGNELRIER